MNKLKSSDQPAPPRSRDGWLPYVLWPVLAAIASCLNVFVFPGEVFSFEQNDEVAHSFVEIPLAWEAIKAGALPLMNLYNNFGTPILGEPVVNPVAALQALSYVLMPVYLASTVNRFLAIALTGIAAGCLYRRYFGLSKVTSIACSMFITLVPAFQHFSFHHPHQFAPCYFMLVLIAWLRFVEESTWLRGGLVWLACVALLVGTGVNGLMFGFPVFVTAAMLKTDPGRRLRQIASLAVIFAGAAIVVAPHFWYFLRIVKLTSRHGLDYGSLSAMPGWEAAQSILFYGQGRVLLHVKNGMFLSLPLCILVIYGLFRLPRDYRRWAVWLLGAAPTTLVVLLHCSSHARELFGVLQAMDTTRFLWFSNFYLVAAAGFAPDRLSTWRPALVTAVTALASATWVIFFMSQRLQFPEVQFTHYEHEHYVAGIGVFLFVAITMLAAAAWLRRHRRVARKRRLLYALAVIWPLIGSVAVLLLGTTTKAEAIYVLIWAMVLPFVICWRITPSRYELIVAYAVLAAVFPYHFDQLAVRRIVSDVLLVNEFHHHRTHGFATRHEAEFPARRIQAAIEPQTRYSFTEEPTSNAWIALLNSARALGSEGRSIVLHGPFRRYVLERGLVKTGFFGMTYYFVSNDSEPLAELGIRYVITRSPARYDLNEWKVEAVDGDLTLLKSGKNAALGYVRDSSGRTPLPVLLRPNRIEVDLASLPAGGMATATFIAWPGWSATVDGQPTQLVSQPDQLLHVAVQPTDRKLVFEFRPITGLQWLGLALTGFVVGALGVWIGRTRTGRDAIEAAVS